MRALFMLAVIASLAFAQFDEADRRLVECREGCCAAYGGTPGQDDTACEIAEGNLEYQACRNACTEEAGREYSAAAGGSGPCCAPALIAAALAAAGFGRMRKR